MSWILPSSLQSLHEERRRALEIPRWQPYLEAIAALNPNSPADIHQCAKLLCPWKKGPFELSGTHIEAEWNCHKKWQRLLPHLPQLTDKNILDVGAGNGWYLRQLRQQGATQVTGFDPAPMSYLQWLFLHKLEPTAFPPLYLLGNEELPLVPKTFDLILHMGVLYHHRDPIKQLVDLREALVPGGELYLETIGIPGTGPHCYLPPDRYANMYNVWFLPTLEALLIMLARARFTAIEVLSQKWQGAEEQRATEWSEGPSYQGSLCLTNPQLTIEGHPAPERFLLRARSKVLA